MCSSMRMAGLLDAGADTEPLGLSRAQRLYILWLCKAMPPTADVLITPLLAGGASITANLRCPLHWGRPGWGQVRACVEWFNSHIAVSSCGSSQFSGFLKARLRD